MNTKHGVLAGATGPQWSLLGAKHGGVGALQVTGFVAGGMAEIRVCYAVAGQTMQTFSLLRPRYLGDMMT